MITALSFLTISPGFHAEATNVYLHGASEIRATPHAGMRGDLAVFVGSETGDGPFAENHTVFVGSALHPVEGRAFDPYLALQPGLSLVREPGGPRQLEPVASVVLGANLTASPAFHFFAEARQVGGRGLVETRVAFGLGAHLRLRSDDRHGG